MKTPFKDINHEEAYPRILTYSESVYFLTSLSLLLLYDACSITTQSFIVNNMF